MRRPNPLVIVLFVSATLLLAGCAYLKGTLPQEKGLHPRLTPYAYLEEGSLVALGVDTEPTRRREAQDFIPLAVGVANKGLDELTLTRESFTLIDAEGRRYGMASVAEVRGLGMVTTYDYRLAEQFFSVFSSRWSSWPRISAVFFPRQASDRGLRFVQRRSILRERVELHRRSWMIDMIYFPHPEGKILDQYFEVWLDAPELEEPVFVKFRVR